MACLQVRDESPQKYRDGKTRMPGTLLHWLGSDDAPAVSGAIAMTEYAVFELSGWRFSVRTDTPEVVRELDDFVRSVRHHPKADVRFTHELLRSTGEKKIDGWAWKKERIAPCTGQGGA